MVTFLIIDKKNDTIMEDGNNIILYNKEREGIFRFSQFDKQVSGTYFNLEVSLSWYHVKQFNYISHKRFCCIKRIISNLYNCKVNSAVISFSSCIFIVDLMPTGVLLWKCAIKGDNMNACFYFTSDITFLPELLAQMNNCKSVKRYEKSTTDSFLFRLTVLSTSYDVEIGIAITSKEFEIYRTLQITIQELLELRTSIDYLMKYGSPMSFSSLGDFMIIKMRSDNGMFDMECDINDFNLPSNRFHFTRRIRNIEITDSSILFSDSNER